MSIIRADSIKNRAGDGAPDFPNGITVTGIVTATTLNSVTNNVDVDDFISVGNNIHLGNAGVCTATTFSGSGANLTNIPDSAISALTASKLTGALPAIDGSNLTGTSAGLQSMNVYTTPGTATWTKPSGITKVKVIVTGGGGGCSAVGGNRADDIGAGGAAGGTAIKIIDVSSISSVTVTVGMGGTATPANYNDTVSSSTSPNDGAPSSFGSHCSATGGKAGRSYYTNNAGVVGQAVPGVGSGGDINIQGGYGALPILNYNGAPDFLSGGQGGVSFWGGANRGAADDDFTGGNNDASGGASSGSSGGAFGSGGSAGSRNFTGGAGTHGVVVVENYA